MKESKKMMAKEVAFMKKKGAPKSMIKHEMAEAGMKHGGKAYRLGGVAARSAKLGPVTRGAKAGAGIGGLGKEERPMPRQSENMKSGGKAYAGGGMTKMNRAMSLAKDMAKSLTPKKPAPRPVAGKPPIKKLPMPPSRMASGGLAAGHKAADGVAKKGRTSTTMVKMMRGGKAC